MYYKQKLRKTVFKILNKFKVQKVNYSLMKR